MAKKSSEPGFVEQHIEKLVLGAAALILLLVAQVWLRQSPHTAKFGAVEVPPREVDQQLEKVARETQRHIGSRVPEPVDPAKPPEWQGWLARLIKPTVAVGKPSLFLPLVEGPKPLAIGPGGGVKRLSAFSPPPPPGKALVWAGPELIRSRFSGRTQDVAVSHVVCEWDYATVVETWRKELQEVGLLLGTRWVRIDRAWQRDAQAYTRPQMLILGTSLLRREKLPNGQWSDPDAVDGVPSQAGMTQLPALPDRAVLDPPLEEQIAPFESPGMQQQILQPDYFEVFWEEARNWGTWRHHLPVTSVSMSDTAVTVPPPTIMSEGAPEPVAEVPPTTPFLERLAREREERRRSPAGEERPKPTAAKAQALALARAGETAFQAGNFDLAEKRFTAALKLDPELMDARQRLQDIPIAKRASKFPVVTAVPELGNQCREGKVLIWVHDAGVTPGHTYQYKVRLKVLNPLALWPQVVEEETLAEQVVFTVTSPEWSDEKTVAPTTRFFVSGGSAQKQQVRFEIFRLAKGQVLRQDQTVTVGDPIGEETVRKYVLPSNLHLRAPGLKEEPIDFGTGHMLVDIGDDRPGGGSRQSRTLGVLLLTPEGKLIARSRDADSRDPELVSLRDRAREYERAIRDGHMEDTSPDSPSGPNPRPFTRPPGVMPPRRGGGP